MKKTVIVSGGSIEQGFALGFLKEYQPDCIIGADRGIEFLLKVNYRPDYIVGDFDSGSQETLKVFEDMGVPVRKFQPMKDDTDTQIALQLALELGSTCIYILGATGSRLDHVLGNIKILNLPMKQGIPCYLLDGNNRIQMIDHNLSLKKREQFGKYVSLLAHTSEVTGLTLEGFAYPLKDYTLSCDRAIGISNEIAEEEAHISLLSGSLIVVESHD